MDRREALKLVGLMLGGAVSSSVAARVLAGCNAAPGRYAPQTLTPAQDDLVATVAELIIPETDTPGARAARVNEFVDRMLTAGYADDERDRFLAGLADLDARAQAAGGKAFVASTTDEQTALLTALEAEAKATRQAGAAVRSFFAVMKELTLVGFYTSEIGATQELQTVTVPGRYDGDAPLAEIGRAFA